MKFRILFVVTTILSLTLNVAIAMLINFKPTPLFICAIAMQVLALVLMLRIARP